MINTKKKKGKKEVIAIFSSTVATCPSSITIFQNSKTSWSNVLKPKSLYLNNCLSHPYPSNM